MNRTTANLRRILLMNLALLITGLCNHCVAQSKQDAKPPLRIATFQCDVTPPLGSPINYGFGRPAQRIVDPLSARGVILLTKEKPIVLCVIDWVALANGAHDAWREALADAVGTTTDRVSVHVVHQHDAPGVDFSAAEIVAAYGDHGPGYIGTTAAYSQGGYEVGPPSNTAPEVEGVLMSAMRELLEAKTINSQDDDGSAALEGKDTVVGPRDLALSYHSSIDNTTQPYRLYLPSAYDGKRLLPLLIALHGTGGDQNKYFDHPDYNNGVYKKEAEKRGLMVVCPHGRGTTEYRGIGENDVLTIVDEVCRRFLVDRDRLVCSGQSMGGTGTTYLCCRYPDLFAGGVPLASTYGHLTLVENLRHVPMLYVQGEKDWPVYAQDGPIPITRRMKELGYRGRLLAVPGAEHNTMKVTTSDVLDWAIMQRRVKHPRRVTFRVYLPIHGKAYWTELLEIDQIGPFAEIDATIQSDNRIDVSLKNARRVALRPEPELLDLPRPIRVVVNGKQAFLGRCSGEQEIRLTLNNDRWTGTIGIREVRPLLAYRTHKIGTVIVPPRQPRRWDTSDGKMIAIPQTRTKLAETSMGSWIADAIRDASGADIAIYNRRYYRGIPLRENQEVYLIDLLNWFRPTNRCLSTFEITGKGLLEIIEDNIRDAESEDEFLLQVSGCRYEFDRRRAKGARIVESDIDPDRKYRIACESHMLSRGDTCFLAGRLGKLPYKELDITNVSATWRHIVKNNGQIEGKRDGRVRDLTPAP